MPDSLSGKQFRITVALTFENHKFTEVEVTIEAMISSDLYK